MFISKKVFDSDGNFLSHFQGYSTQELVDMYVKYYRSWEELNRLEELNIEIERIETLTIKTVILGFLCTKTERINIKQC